MAALWLLVVITAVSLELSVIARERRLGAANTLEGTSAPFASCRRAYSYFAFRATSACRASSAPNS